MQTPVESTERINLASQRHLLNHFKLVTELGGEVLQVASANVLDEIIKTCQEKQITTICMGQPAFKMPSTLFSISKYKKISSVFGTNEYRFDYTCIKIKSMNIKTKLTLTIGILVAMIVLLVALSVVNLQILTATDPDSPAAGPGLQRALLWISIVGAACICVGIGIWLRLPASINKPIKEITNGIQEIANHNYEKRLDLNGNQEFAEVSKNFNRMAKRLEEYHASTLSEMMAAKKYMETIINSINEPIIGLNNEMEILFINDEALNVLNLKREEVIKRSAQEISMRNDLLRRLVRELIDIPSQKIRK